MSRRRRWTRWSGCMMSCFWHAWPARSSRANLSRPVGLAASTRLALASPSTDGLQGLRGACLARDRVSLSRVILRGVNHPSEVTQTPIEIQLRTLRKTLGDDLVRDLEDSVAPNTWRAYRSDLADFATWVAYTGAEWRAPEVVATYLRTLEDGGAAYTTISRRLTSMSCSISST